MDDTIRDAEKEIAQRWSVELHAPVEFRGRRQSFAAIRIGDATAANPAGNSAQA